MDDNELSEHINTLKNLLKARHDLTKSRNANSDLLPRIGTRGGTATTLVSRHNRCAEYAQLLEFKAASQAEALWGFGNIDKGNFLGRLTFMDVGKEHTMAAKAAYDAYKISTGGKSAITGDPLPDFFDLPANVYNAWHSAAQAVMDICRQ